MGKRENEIAKRTTAALAAIKQSLDTEEVSLFVSHHVAELDATYWEKHAGTMQPNSKQVVALLHLREHWGDEDENGLDTFDFTLPGDVTDYVISVRFDEDGEIEDISMES
jgi:hypothetical protein